MLIDDAVIKKDENYPPRNQWTQGRIINLAISSDNLIRGEREKRGKRSIIQRPIQKLVP